MICEKCGSNDVKVVDVVHNNDAYETYRKKVCNGCGRTFYTMEFEAEENVDFLDSWCTHHRDGHKAARAKKQEDKNSQEFNYHRDAIEPNHFHTARVGDYVKLIEHPHSFSFVGKDEVVKVGKVYDNGCIGVHYSEFKHFPEYRQGVINNHRLLGVARDEVDDLIIPKDEHFTFLQFDYLIVKDPKK